jgi:MOSC domain-containing protein YiiM
VIGRTKIQPGRSPSGPDRILPTVTKTQARSITIVSVNVGRPTLLVKWPNDDLMSSIDKRPVEASSLWLSRTNLEGDEQADQRPTPDGQVHGGPEKAVYAYPADHFADWSVELGQSVGPGLFGENLTTLGITETDAFIGDIWEWGEALLQVRQPRLPCYKLGYRIGRQVWRKRFRESGRTGWYLSVIREGRVPTRGVIKVVERHSAGVTVAEVVAAVDRAASADDRILALDVLPAGLRRLLAQPERDHTGGVPESD